MSASSNFSCKDYGLLGSYGISRYVLQSTSTYPKLLVRVCETMRFSHSSHLPLVSLTQDRESPPAYCGP